MLQYAATVGTSGFLPHEVAHFDTPSEAWAFLAEVRGAVIADHLLEVNPDDSTADHAAGVLGMLSLAEFAAWPRRRDLRWSGTGPYLIPAGDPVEPGTVYEVQLVRFAEEVAPVPEYILKNDEYGYLVGNASYSEAWPYNNDFRRIVIAGSYASTGLSRFTTFVNLPADRLYAVLVP